MVGLPAAWEKLGHMVHDVDTVYMALRKRVLSGELVPGTVIASAEVEQSFGVNDKKVRQVLTSLAGDGYLHRVQSTYTVIGYSHQEVEEWWQTLCAICELGAARLILDGDRHCEPLKRHLAAPMVGGPASDERFYLWSLEVYATLLGGQRSQMTAFANQLVPPMFFRLWWLAEIEAGNGDALRKAVDQVINAVCSDRDVRAGCDALRGYFEKLAKALHAQLDRRNAGSGPDLLGDVERTVEHRITGHTNYIRTPSAPKQMLPRLQTNPAASLKGFIPD